MKEKKKKLIKLQVIYNIYLNGKYIPDVYEISENLLFKCKNALPSASERN